MMIASTVISKIDEPACHESMMHETGTALRDHSGGSKNVPEIRSWRCRLPRCSSVADLGLALNVKRIKFAVFSPTRLGYDYR